MSASIYGFPCVFNGEMMVDGIGCVRNGEMQFNNEQEIRDLVVKQLVKSGVRPERIVCEKWICRDSHERYAADVAVMNEWFGIDAVFEVKLRNGKDPKVVQQVLFAMEYVIGLCQCYLVTEEDGELIVARLSKNGLKIKWQKLSKLKLAPENSEREIRDYERKQIVAVGLILVAIFVWGERLGPEFSWKIYSLLTLVAVLFAAASGYRFSFKAGPDGCALSVGRDKA